MESDEPAPVVIEEPSLGDVSIEKFREVLAELDCEKQARPAAEKSSSQLQVSFSRLKASGSRGAIKKRGEALSEKEETQGKRWIAIGDGDLCSYACFWY